MKEIILNTKITVYRIEECTKTEKKLIDAAKDATKSSYAPYSNFHVGVSVLLENGEIIKGNNQENAAYPSGLCAERTAVFYTNANYPDQKIVAIAITAFHNNSFTKDVITPCGACRQVLLESENRQKSPIQILMCTDDSVYRVESVKDLLPLSFGDEMLK